MLLPPPTPFQVIPTPHPHIFKETIRNINAYLLIFNHLFSGSKMGERLAAKGNQVYTWQSCPRPQRLDIYLDLYCHGWGDGLVVRGTCCSCRGLDLVPTTHTVAHSYL